MVSIEKLEARLDGIGHLLGDRYIEVPPYQRAYSWTDEQVEDLFKDISDAIRERNAEYFLGTVVLTTNKDGSHAVIDGQQRLANRHGGCAFDAALLQQRRQVLAGGVNQGAVSSRGTTAFNQAFAKRPRR